MNYPNCCEKCKTEAWSSAICKNVNCSCHKVNANNMPQENKDWEKLAEALDEHGSANFRAINDNVKGKISVEERRNLCRESDLLVLNEVQNLLDKQRNEIIKLLSQDIGMLRQWLNEG